MMKHKHDSAFNSEPISKTRFWGHKRPHRERDRINREQKPHHLSCLVIGPSLDAVMHSLLIKCHLYYYHEHTHFFITQPILPEFWTRLNPADNTCEIEHLLKELITSWNISSLISLAFPPLSPFLSNYYIRRQETELRARKPQALLQPSTDKP